MAPIVTLLTDFGAGSGYPAQLKGVILGIAQDAQVVDISHDVPPFDLLTGALMLEACVPHFPLTAIHCAVVDPGVGTPRMPICVVDGDGRRLVGPDNGLFTPFLGPQSRVWALSDIHFVPDPASATFHGRDLFAPVAAKLALGVEPEQLGSPVPVPVRLEWPEPRVEGGELSGHVVLADTFGNLITDIRRSHIPQRKGVTIWLEDRPARWVRTYGEGAAGELLALFGSSGRLELAVREGSAVRLLSRGRGAAVRVRLSPAS